MYSIDILIATGLCALVVGGLLGMLYGRNSTSGSQQARDLKKEIDQLNRDKRSYENRVTEHFTETADRLNTLTEMYRGIHEHLAEGTSTLCVGKKDITVKRLGSTAEGSEIPPEAMDVEPPRDYAPKTEGETGVLNETFGIERDTTPGNEGMADAADAEDVPETPADAENKEAADKRKEDNA